MINRGKGKKQADTNLG